MAGLIDWLARMEAQGRSTYQAEMAKRRAEAQTPAASLLAKQLYQQGLGSDPAAIAAAQQMMSPALRGQGMATAQAMIAPGAAQARELAGLEQQYGVLRNTATAQGISQGNAAESRAAGMYPWQLELLQAQIDAAKAARGASGRSASAAMAKIEGTLRDDFAANQQVSDFHDTWNSAEQLRASLARNSAVGAEGAIIKLARIYDPGGVVREGEAQVYRGSFGALLALQNAVNKAKGEGFTEQTRKDIENLVDDVLQASLGGYEAIVDQYTGMALRNGVDPQNVIAVPISQGAFEAFLQRQRQRLGRVRWDDLNPGATGTIERGAGR